MATEIEILIWTAVGVAAGSLAGLALHNRKRINTIALSLFGVERDETEAGEGHLLRVEYKLDTLQERLDETKRQVEAIYNELAEQSDEDFEEL